MDAIKKVLQPGKAKDDEVMYGQGSTAPKDAGEGAFNAGVPTGEDAPELHTLPKEKKESHGILRQILNPGGEKYSELSYGSTATTDANAAGVADNTGSESKSKEHGVLRQVLNPGNDKYDPDNFKAGDDAYAPPAGQPVPGALATGSEAQQIRSTEAAEKKGGVLSQIVNPGGDKYDETRFEPTGNVATGSSTAPATATAHESHAGRDAALGAGAGAAAYEAGKQHHLSGDYDKNTQSGLLGTTTATSSATAAPQTSTAPTQSGLTSTASPASHHGTEAALGTGALAAGGVAASQHNAGQNTGLSHHVYNGVADPPPTKSGHVHDFGATKTHIVGVTEGIPPAEPVSHPHGPSYNIPSAEEEPGSSAKVYNTVTGKHSGHEYDTPQHGSSEVAKDAATGTALVGATSSLPEYSSTSAASGPSSTTTATSAPTSTTPQHQTIGTTGGTAAAALAAQEAARRHQTQQAGFAAPGTSTSTAPQHHHGRDAAIASGVAAGGVGTYEASKHTDSGPASKTVGPHDSNVANVLDPRVKPQPELQKSSGGDATGPASKTIGPHSSNIANVLDPRVKPQPELQGATRHSEKDAAVGAATAGAVGAGAYEAGKHSDTGPASKTIGPHDSNIANILDPRVKPEPELQKGDTTTAQKPTHTGGLFGVTAGAAIGTAQWEAASKDTPPSDSTATQTTTTTSTTTSTSGPHKSSLLNKLDPRVKDEDKESHTGRDTAIAGGTGAAVGAGAYEASKHDHTSTSAGLHQSDAANKLDPRVDSTTGQTTAAAHTTPSTTAGQTTHTTTSTTAGQTSTTSYESPSTTTGAGTASGVDAVIEEGHQIDKKHRGPQVREDEHGHNKLHKEKKEGFLHKLLHPHKKEHEHEAQDATADTTSSTAPSGSVTEPHTGLPINVDKYGSGAGGTDGSEQIAGYQSSGAAHAADYDDIAKKNTTY